ncbi:hypothetical protein [Geotalea uraniireducens]|uniref:Uncharacterized protein n=1 Tax=Geotalea uraniireducens (strain Rf4) TaxID=351605 RepID=A5GBZ8_GEOUR|nr:hypothetical protein [Geotalea uraniireducens]ABQ24906.1 hypothetical protein Gura_0694 [Geotalea uraniireducens Rf4]
MSDRKFTQIFLNLWVTFGVLTTLLLTASGNASEFPNDTFDGTVVDTSYRWTIASTYGYSAPESGGVGQDERLIIKTQPNLSYSQPTVGTKYEFTGDFDVQVDFEIGSGWSSPVSGHIDGAAMSVVIGDNPNEPHIYRITRSRYPDMKDQLWIWVADGYVRNTAALINTTATTGKYRVVRNGNVLTFSYDFGSGWQTLGSVNAIAGSARIYLDAASVSAFQAITSYFDNFKVTSAFPNDTFDGTVVDTSCRWTIASTYGYSAPEPGGVGQDERLIIKTQPNLSYSQPTVGTKYEFTGDFDVQVDFEIGSGWSSPVSGHIDGAAMSVVIGDNPNEPHIYRITRSRYPDMKDQLWIWVADGYVRNTAALINTTATTGKYRVVRNGNVLTFSYDFGSGWQTLGSVNAIAGSTRIYLDAASVSAFQAITSYFDNFKVNSGLTIPASCQ